MLNFNPNYNFNYKDINNSINFQMIRGLFKWSLEITGVGIIGYHTIYHGQQRHNLIGAYSSIVNSARATHILYKSIRDYLDELSEIEYNTEQYHKKRSEIHYRVANRILQLSKTNKGQYLGNLQRVVPHQFTQVLSVLQDSAPPMDYEDIKVVIQEDLKMKPKQLFDLFKKQSIAAASLAQVHRAILTQTGQQVAVKLQYPSLRTQSQYDLYVLQKITEICNYFMKKNSYNDVDLLKLFFTWTNTLKQQLDFKIEVENALKTKRLFKEDKSVYVPIYVKKYCTERIVVMQYVEGCKINDKKAIQKLGIDPILVAKQMTRVFTEMIFKHRFVHCDAHPGNILVRKSIKNPLGFEIILLDHGLYRNLDEQSLKNFSGLWLALVQANKDKTQKYAQKLNMGKHYEYLPIIFLHRSTQTSKKLGDPMTPQQFKYFKQKNLANFQSINYILQDLPPDLMFIIRASNLIASHCLTLGGNTRHRIMQYTRHSIRYFAKTEFQYKWWLFLIGFRIWFFEHFFTLYKLIFGTLA